jgi:hypothetical protein
MRLSTEVYFAASESGEASERLDQAGKTWAKGLGIDYAIRGMPR